MNSNTFGILATHLLLSVILICAALFVFQKLHVDFLNKKSEYILDFLISANIIITLIRLKRKEGYSQNFLKSFILSLLIYIFSVIVFRFVAEAYYKIEMYWVPDLKIYQELIIKIFMISLLIAFFFRRSKKVKSQSNDLID